MFRRKIGDLGDFWPTEVNYFLRSLPLPLATGRKFDTFIALSYYTLIANPITPKNPKIFMPHQFFVKFCSKKADKMRNIFVGH